MDDPRPDYEGSLYLVGEAARSDVLRAKECVARSESSPPTPDRVRLFTAEGRVFSELRERLERAVARNPELFDGKMYELLERARPANGPLRERARQVMVKVVDTWSSGCPQMLTYLDGSAVNRYAASWALAPDAPNNAAARAALADLAAAHGSAWMDRELRAAGAGAYQPGRFGPSRRRLLAECPPVRNAVAPMGPVFAEGELEKPFGIRLPRARSAGSALGDGLRVFLSPSALTLGSDLMPTAKLDADAGSAGFGPANKSAPNDLTVLPLRDALAKRKESHDAEVLLFIDAQVSFRALMELLFTLSQSGFTRFFLVTESSAPALRGFATNSPAAQKPQPILLLVNDGYAVRSVDNATLAPGCAALGSGVAVPKSGSAYEPSALLDCLRKAMSQRLLGSDLEGAFMTANPATPYGDVIGAFDSLVAANLARVEFRVPR